MLADLTRKIAKAGVDLDLVYVATCNRVVFGSADLVALWGVPGRHDLRLTAAAGCLQPDRPAPSQPSRIGWWPWDDRCRESMVKGMRNERNRLSSAGRDDCR